MIARSFLFVPADRPERFAKALDSGAGAVIVDLEDAVAPAVKAGARDGLAAWLDSTAARPVYVRINPSGTPWHDDDLGLLRHPAVHGLMLPKAEDPAAVEAMATALGPGRSLIALIETVAGWAACMSIARVHGVSRLAFGHLDFMADSGVREEGSELDPVRLQLVLASRLAGLPPPIDGVTPKLGDAAALAGDVRRARRLGFGGKLCIHPSQVAEVEEGFRPGDDEVDWARRVVAALAAGPAGAVAVDGKLVDKPVELLARSILAQVEAR